MAKQITNQKYIYKIHSSRFKMNNWSLNLSFEEAIRNEEIVPIGDSTTLRMISKIRQSDITEEEITKIKKEIKKLKKESFSKDNKEKIKIKQNELNSKTLNEDYLAIVFDSIKDWNRANSIKYSLFFNGTPYVRLVGTNGGVKKNVVVFCKKEIHEELDRKMNNGRNKKKKSVPAKFESYKALTSSASTPVRSPKGILVIKDGETVFKDKVLQLTDDGESGFKLNQVDDYEIHRAFTDGCGMISEKLCKEWMIDLGLYKINEDGGKEAEYTSSGFNIRNSWCKGVVFTFPYLEFAEEVSKKYMVKDAWGNMIDIRNVELILTTNMVKLWDSYTSVDHYLQCCEENDYCFSVAKVLPNELEKVRFMNYQFLQSYELTDDDIKELIKPTLDTIKGAISEDYAKTLLFLKGIKITEEDYKKEDYNYLKALMINKELIKDPFIKQRIYNAIKKKIKDSQKGVLEVNGNYSVISGDLYCLCEYMFGMKVKGLLNKNEFYSYEWNNRKDEEGDNINKVVAFRAPMSVHNNIRILNLVNNDKVKKWYRFMKTCIICNAWDCTMEALNGADMDGDAIITTNCKTLLSNTKQLPAIICEQQTAEKEVIKEHLLRKANKNGFYNDVGGVTNKCTGMYDVLASLEKGTTEYEEMEYRIICMQGYQQEVIDSIKGIVPKEVPRHWYSYKTLKIKDGDSEEKKEWKTQQLKIASIKKPYFFIYNYEHLMRRYHKYINNYNTNSLIRFGLTLEELELKENKNKKELDFLKFYHLRIPVSMQKSTMNRICWALEKEYKDLKLTIKKDNFDKEILKSDVKYKKSLSEQIKIIYDDYKREVKQYMKTSGNLNKEEKQEKRQIFIESFRQQIFEICNNEKIVCNILVDMCYSQTNSKQFVWDVCGDVILNNLLEKNDYKIHYPIQDDTGDIIWQGQKFKMIEKQLPKEDIEEVGEWD